MLSVHAEKFVWFVATWHKDTVSWDVAVRVIYRFK